MPGMAYAPNRRLAAAAMMTPLLKRCWKAAPQSLRLLFLAGLCSVRAGRRVRATPGDGPLLICGALRGNSGQSQGARLMLADVRARGLQAWGVDVTRAMRMAPVLPRPDGVLDIEQAARLEGPATVIIHANPPQFQLALCALGREFLHDKRVVAYWAWELEAFPSIWRHALAYVDAIETPSHFVAAALQTLTHKPVSVRPHPVAGPRRHKSAWAAGGRIRCLSIFDAGSSFERKNPEAALSAFARAFAPGEAELTFKVSNPEADAERFARFSKACAATPGVSIITETLASDALEDLYLAHDIYLSLHRSEGFGLTILEAMRHGLHAVATGWSGNMDFMIGELAHPVPFRLTPVRAASGPCKGLAARWAEADVDAAARILRRLGREIQAVHA